MNTGAYILVVAGIFLAKCMGFLRDIIFASSFGASEYTDIYFQVFGIASLVFTGIGGALSTLVIKNLNKGHFLDKEKEKNYVASFILRSCFATVICTGVLNIFSGLVIDLILPGLSSNMHSEAVTILRIMLPSCIFVIGAYIIAGVLQNAGVFFITSVMSLPYNAIIIASLFVPQVSIKTVSIVTTVGWFLHLAILLPSYFKKGYHFVPDFKGAEKNKSTNREVLYIFISGMMFQLVFMIDKASVSSDGGAASTVNYASNLFVTIASVFVVAMSNVSYPSLCRHFESGNKDAVRKTLAYIITLLFAIFVPFILTVSFFGKDIISLLYERGEFTSEMSRETAYLFGIYTLGIFGYVCQELLNKVLYLDSKYRYTVTGTLIVVLAKPFINAFLCKGNAILVSIATTVLFSVYAVCILIAIIKSVGNYFKGTLFVNLMKISVSALLSVICLEILKGTNLPLSDTKFSFAVPLIICAAVYIISLFALGCIKYILRFKTAVKE